MPYLVYPSKAVLVWKRRSADLDGREDIAGQLWEEQRLEFDLWPDSEPADMPLLG